MRVTTSMLNTSALNDLSTSAEKLLEAQLQSSSGKRILKPSDDVAGTASAMRLRSSISQIEQLQRNSNQVESKLTVTLDSLDNIIDIIQEVRTVAVNGANSTNSESSRLALIEQVKACLKSLSDAANTKYEGKYIFSGSMTDTASIVQDAGGTYQYQGDDAQFSVQVTPGSYVTANVTANQVLNMDGGSISGRPDLFASMQNLIDEISAGDTTAISDHIEEIDDFLQNTSTIRSQIGARLSRLETSSETLANTKTIMQELLSETEDADLAEAYVTLSTRQNCYESAVAVAQKLLNMSLVNYFD